MSCLICLESCIAFRSWVGARAATDLTGRRAREALGAPVPRGACSEGPVLAAAAERLERDARLERSSFDFARANATAVERRSR